MNKWNDESLLEIVEELAAWEGMVSSEDELSEMYDGLLEENHRCGGKHPEEYTKTDINCNFNDWKDGLMKDGTIHDEQCNQYCYEGKYGNQ